MSKKEAINMVMHCPPVMRGNMHRLLPGCVIAVLIATSPLPSDAAAAKVCPIDTGPCVTAANGMSVVLDITPRPVRAMRELLLTVTVQEGERKRDDAEVTVALSMPGMDMGPNRIRLSHKGGGTYEGTGVIVRCMSGERLWQATVTIVRQGRSSTAEFQFEVH